MKSNTCADETRFTV